MDEWINEWMDSWLVGWLVGWMDRWMDGYTVGGWSHKICRLQSRLLNRKERGRGLKKEKGRRGRRCIAGRGRDDGVAGSGG